MRIDLSITFPFWRPASRWTPSSDPYLVLDLLLRSPSSSALRRVIDARHSSVCQPEARVPADTCLSAATLDFHPTLDVLDLITCKRCVYHLPSSHRCFTVLLSVSPSAPLPVRYVAPFSPSGFWNHHNTEQNTSKRHALHTHNTKYK